MAKHKATYGAKSKKVSNDEDSANEGVTFEADSPEDARQQAADFAGLPLDLIDGVVNEESGETIRFE